MTQSILQIATDLVEACPGTGKMTSAQRVLLAGMIAEEMSRQRQEGYAAGASDMKALLADIVSFRDECLVAKLELISAADPTGDARLAYGVVTDQLTELIKRHTEKRKP